MTSKPKGELVASVRFLFGIQKPDIFNTSMYDVKYNYERQTATIYDKVTKCKKQ